MLQGSLRRETIKRENHAVRDWRDARFVACAQVQVGFGPVEIPTRNYKDKDGNLVISTPSDSFVLEKPDNGCLSFTTVPVTWEILDNREAILR